VNVSDKKILSFEEYADDPNYVRAEVVTRKGTVALESCSSESILEWIDDNESEDTARRRFRGLRLVARCIVNPDGSRIPTDMLPQAVERLRKHDASDNEPLIKAAFEVNGLRLAPKAPAPNVSSEALTNASPTDSPSQ
jgi:hypothetical protein